MKSKIGITIVAALILIAVKTSKAQLLKPPNLEEIPRQSVYLELGGNALIYSLNYDVVFHSNWGFRLGGGYYPASANDGVFYASSTGSNAFMGLIMGLRLFGKVPNQLETGVGYLFGSIDNPQEWHTIKPPGLTFAFGYRYYPTDPNKVTFKVAFTPVINGSGFHPVLGISLGITLTAEGNTTVFH